LSVVITNPGSNYTAPTVTIGGCTGGTAIASLGDGTFGNNPFTAGITAIDMTSQPSACTLPTVTIAGTTGSGATAVAIMSTNTEVKMVLAVPVIVRPATLPNCSAGLEPPMDGRRFSHGAVRRYGKPVERYGPPDRGSGTELLAAV
jgi:hypothetical protein